MKPGDYGGWTCQHVSNNAGPCWKCAPASNECGHCGKPIDNHPLVKAPGQCQEVAA